MIVRNKRNFRRFNCEYIYDNYIKELIQKDEHIDLFEFIFDEDKINENNIFKVDDNIIKSFVNVKKDINKILIFEYLARNKLSKYKSFKIFINDITYNRLLFNIKLNNINTLDRFLKYFILASEYHFPQEYILCDILVNPFFLTSFIKNKKNYSDIDNEFLYVFVDNYILITNDYIDYKICSDIRNININDFIVEYQCYYNKMKCNMIIDIKDNEVIYFDEKIFV